MLERGGEERGGEERKGEERRGDGEVSCGDFFGFLLCFFLSSPSFLLLFFFFSVLLNMRLTALTALPARVSQIKPKNPSPT